MTKQPQRGCSLQGRTPCIKKFREFDVRGTESGNLDRPGLLPKCFCSSPRVGDSLNEYAKGNVHFMKGDVEGFEQEALPGFDLKVMGSPSRSHPATGTFHRYQTRRKTVLCPEPESAWKNPMDLDQQQKWQNAVSMK